MKNGEQYDIKAGELGVALGDGPQAGRIMLVLPQPQKWVALDPQMAAHVGKDLIDKAVACGFKVTLSMPRREVTNTIRTMLANRVSIVMRSMQEKGRKPDFIAQELVDIVLREVT